MPKIAIGVPVYNQAGTIGATIEALLAQKVAAHRIVVSENHSTDGTREVVESYRGRIEIVRPPTHCGISENWNFCVNSCDADWVGLCSGDDMLLPNYIADMKQAISRHPSAVFAMGGWENYFETSQKVVPHYLLSMGAVTAQPEALRMQLRGPKASFATFCFKKATFERTEGFDRRFKVMQDWMFQFELAKHGDFTKINKLVARYRIADRPELMAKRHPLFVADRAEYLTRKIWEAADYGVSVSAVTAAARDVFVETLHFASSHQVIVMGDLSDKLAIVATKLGQEDIWQKWMDGALPPPRNALGSRFKKMIKGMISYGLSLGRQ